MEHNFVHVFRLVVDGLSEPIEFEMYHASGDVAEVVDTFAKYVARLEDDFLPLGETGAVRANRIVRIDHTRATSLRAN